MDFKIDENLPSEIGVLLSEAGHDAKTVNQQNLQGTPDSNLIEVCKNEGRVLVTLDMDFSDIRAYPPDNYSGIIVLRLARQSKPYAIDVFRRVLPHMGREPLKGQLWIVEENSLRIRGGA